MYRPHGGEGGTFSSRADSEEIKGPSWRTTVLVTGSRENRDSRGGSTPEMTQ